MGPGVRIPPPRLNEGRSKERPFFIFLRESVQIKFSQIKKAKSLLQEMQETTSPLLFLLFLLFLRFMPLASLCKHPPKQDNRNTALIVEWLIQWHYWHCRKQGTR